MTSHATLPWLLPRNEWPAGDPGKGPRHPADFYLAEYYREVRDFALGLTARGVRRGDKLAVIGDNRPRTLATRRREAIALQRKAVRSHAFGQGLRWPPAP
jgi:hypothetical protein